ncbi:MAG TPA: hypothetical protein DEG09_11055 [Marinilabiliaceae bacterium]|nr:hypothetical protein [Marinilabiliaceae bacterium]HBX89134.1 hypothetical protein [Marinilabiliaceae bacterium]
MCLYSKNKLFLLLIRGLLKTSLSNLLTLYGDIIPSEAKNLYAFTGQQCLKIFLEVTVELNPNRKQFFS